VKLSKLPIDPKTLQKADKTDPRVWGTFADCCAGIACARERWKEENPDTYRGGGLGFVFTEQDPYVGVDLDGCRNPKTSTLEPWARQIMTVLRSYTEISPSGTGLHIYVKGRLSGPGQNKKPIEVYDRKAYFTVTGDRFPGALATIENWQTAVEWLYTAMPILAKLLTDTDKREKFSRLFAGDISEYDGDESRADLAFCNMLVQAGACPDTECMAVIRLSVRIPRIPATQSMGRLPLNPREACHPVHVKAATWTTGRLPPNPGEACHHRSAATLGALVSLIQLLMST
jgi:putative DNA primase/helicase